MNDSLTMNQTTMFSGLLKTHENNFKRPVETTSKTHPERSIPLKKHANGDVPELSDLNLTVQEKKMIYRIQQIYLMLGENQGKIDELLTSLKKFVYSPKELSEPEYTKDAEGKYLTYWGRPNGNPNVFYASETTIKNATHINGKELYQLKAENNVLKFPQPHESFKYVAPSGRAFIYKVYNGTMFVDFEAMEKLGITENDLSQDYRMEAEKYVRFFDWHRANELPMMLWQCHSPQEIKEILSSVGITSGWYSMESNDNYEIRANGTIDFSKPFKKVEFYYDFDAFPYEGIDYPMGKYQIENQRETLNMDWLKKKHFRTIEDGSYERTYFTKECSILINGIRYFPDENGNMNIPAGVPVIDFEIIPWWRDKPDAVVHWIKEKDVHKANENSF